MAEAILLNQAKHSCSLHAIVYLDLLGTTSKIQKDPGDLYLNEIYSLYENVKILTKNGAFSEYGFNDIKVKIFSDNIILAIELNTNNDILKISRLLYFTSIMQTIAIIHHSWLMRGGITLGSLFIDDLLVWGSGLVRAYKLESTFAIYPRIVIDPNIDSSITTELREEKIWDSFFLEDVDGWSFLNFLNHYTAQDAQGNDNREKVLKDSFDRLLKNIEMPNEAYDKKVYQKVQWYKNYVNASCKENISSTCIPILE